MTSTRMGRELLTGRGAVLGLARRGVRCFKRVMCGISGFWLTASVTSGTAGGALRRMTDAIAHRGPDDSDHYWDPTSGVGLGHRRLSIIDLSPDGRQPMSSATQRYVVVFNGEIYNFRAIKTELERAGLAPAWRGSSDTEVMLGAIEAWGLEGAVSRFVGMFAFALWDRAERRLSLVRDRLGVKPLYYSVSKEGLLFGSELSALLAFPGFQRVVDEASVAEFLRLGYVPAPRSIYQGVFKLEPGCILQVGGAPLSERRVTRYWDCRLVAQAGHTASPRSDEAALDALEEALRSAVALRMIADVPIGAFLSGGVDSSLVVALMQAQSSRPVRTFSIGNVTAEYDEGEAASRVAAHLGTDHTSFVITAQDALGVVPQLAAVYDEPFGDSSQIPTLMVSRLARQHVTVALTGDGGDEVFGGYNRHLWAPRVWNVMRTIPAPVRERLSSILLAISAERYEALGRVLPGRARPRMLGAKVHKLLNVLGAASSEAFYRSLCEQWQDPGRVLWGVSAVVRGPLPEVRTGAFASDMMLLDLLTYLPDDVLTKVDRATMSVALEARAPLLDHRVVELGLRLPADLKIRHGVGKWALRRLLYRRVPRQLVDRPKMGFSVPIGEWLRGPLRDWAQGLLEDSAVGVAPFFNAEALAAVWGEHVGGRSDHASKLWTVLMFQSWLSGPNGPNASRAAAG